MFLAGAHRELTAYFNALANPTRLRILERLGQVGEEGVNDLALNLHVSQPRISWHLRLLRFGGLVKTRRTGRQVYCSLDTESIGRHYAELTRMLGLRPAPNAEQVSAVAPAAD
jgi:DNA-binding transcriptional ArsR family regulator